MQQESSFSRHLIVLQHPTQIPSGCFTWHYVSLDSLRMIYIYIYNNIYACVYVDANVRVGGCECERLCAYAYMCESVHLLFTLGHCSHGVVLNCFIVVSLFVVTDFCEWMSINGLSNMWGLKSFRASKKAPGVRP